MIRHLMTGLCALGLAACSGNPLIPPQQESFKVDSLPVGASVLVLDEAMGQTPMTLHRRDVFPRNYDQDKQHLYGRVELRHPGCKPFITTVSSRVLNDGLKAKLECGEQTAAPAAPQPAPIQQEEDSSLKQRLIKLKELHEEGLINDEEYEAKRRQLLEEL